MIQQKHMRFGFRQTLGRIYKASFNYLLLTELSKYITIFQEETLGEVGFFTGGVRRVARVDPGEGKSIFFSGKA